MRGAALEGVGFVVAAPLGSDHGAGRGGQSVAGCGATTAGAPANTTHSTWRSDP